MLEERPILLTAEEVSKLGFNPEALEQVGSYYFYDYTKGRTIEKALYRSSDLEQELE